MLRTHPSPSPRPLPGPGRAAMQAAGDVPSPLLLELRPQAWGAGLELRHAERGTEAPTTVSAIKEDRTAAESSRSRAVSDVCLVTLCFEVRPNRVISLHTGRHTMNTETQT